MPSNLGKFCAKIKSVAEQFSCDAEVATIEVLKSLVNCGAVNSALVQRLINDLTIRTYGDLSSID
jgi:hypothetical protein